MDPLSPSKARKIAKSDHPKTVANRRSVESKVGLDRMELRADGAFRTAKSRILKKLHRSVGWEQKSTAEKQQAEDRAIAELEVTRSQRKRAAEIQFMMMHERGEVDEFDEPMDEVEHADESENMKGVNSSDVESSAGSPSEGVMLYDEGKVSDDEWLTDDDVDVELQGIRKASGDKFWKKLEMWESMARTADREVKEAMLPK